MQNKWYDCAVIGGGIAGLSLAILLAKEGKKVILFEKKSYPFHKVCGEYISNESKAFLQKLGIEFKDYQNTEIKTLRISSPSGYTIERPLSIGGIGISRYELDQNLYQLALNAGVEVHPNTLVNAVEKTREVFDVKFNSNTIQAKTVVGAYGKTSNMDNLSSLIKNSEYVGVKYHIIADYDKSVVEIHNFKDGYCGMSSIENNKINLSYICKKEVLKKYKNLAELEKNVLSDNPHLKKYFQNSSFLFDKPMTISQLHFQIKSPVANHLLNIGDAAGNIAPLSGNGMSIGMLSAKLCAENILRYLNEEISFEMMELSYQKMYYQNFEPRINTAKWINNFFGKKYLTDIGIIGLKIFPFLLDRMSKKIHGKEF